MTLTMKMMLIVLAVVAAVMFGMVLLIGFGVDQARKAATFAVYKVSEPR